MSRVVLFSFLILAALLWFGIKAKKNNQELLATALYTAAVVYTLLMLLSFGGVIQGF